MKTPVVERDSVCALPVGGVVVRYDMGTDTSGPTGVEHLPGQRPRTAKGRDRMDIVAPSPTSVYRYYDESDLLLYVGITSRGIQRNREHNTTKAWWRFVARQEVEHFDTRAEALACERDLIRRYSPPFNTQHNPDHAKMREAYLIFAAARSQQTEWQQEARDVGMRLALDYHDDGGPFVVLRTRIEDAAVSAAIRLEQEGPKPRAIGFRQQGRVVELHRVGPCVLFRLSSKTRHPLTDSWAYLRFDHAKQRHLLIKHITTGLDHSDPSRCTAKCPKPRGVA